MVLIAGDCLSLRKLPNAQRILPIVMVCVISFFLKMYPGAPEPVAVLKD